MADLNQTNIVVENEGETFTFRIPTLRDEARLSTIVQALIAEDNKENEIQLTESSLDANGQLAYRTLAAFKMLLVSTSASWVYTEDPKTKAPVLNANLDPKSLAVYLKYLAKLNEFFRPAPSGSDAAGATPVASQPAA